MKRMGRIDLNAARAARREGQKESIEVDFEDETYTLPPEPPFELADHLAELGKIMRDAEQKKGAARLELQATSIDPMRAMVRILLGDKQWASFVKLRPSVDDVGALFEGALAEYGLGERLGEAQRSPSPSSSTGPRSKRTSKGTTRRT